MLFHLLEHQKIYCSRGSIMEEEKKKIARRRVRGLIIFLIVLFSIILIYDIYLVVSGWVK